MTNTNLYFYQFLETAFDNGNYATDDVIDFLMPLFEEVLSFHESGKVAPFEQDVSLFITNDKLDIDELLAHSSLDATSQISLILKQYKSGNFDVVGYEKMVTDVSEGAATISNLEVAYLGDEHIEQPAYIKGYKSYEFLKGHHDALSDIFCLGLVLGSMSLSLNLYEEDDLNLFATYRTNPVRFNTKIHPTISNLITEMTELDRDKRNSDLYDIIHRMKNYREFEPEKQIDLSDLAGWVSTDLSNRNQFILHRLRNRLFDVSRRNRLLYYKSNMRFVNLTVSSVPMVLHHQSIKPEQLFIWNEDISQKISGQKDIVLNKYLRFEDHVYLSSSIDKIRSECNRDINEYGFSQLKLVIAFLNWHNLKENKNERIQSPLLLIPVELKKTKRLKEDHFTIKILDNEAEVNPIVANQLRDLYGIKLPDFVNLNEMSLDTFYQVIKSQIDEANQGIKLTYSDKPKIKLIHSVAKNTINSYKKRLRKNNNYAQSYKNLPYSYQPEHYKPLGLEIFRQFIEPKHSFLEFLINEDIKLSSNHLTGNDSKSRALYQLTESENNPYNWEFDVCNVVLGNFNYKKMSLVKDYNYIINENVQNTVFDKLFSEQPKNIKSNEKQKLGTEEWYHVVNADPTQTNSILNGRSGESYIIQGPPGTGKSQTITNLIADYLAQNKSVLFVCEKRAALDVVFHRLKQSGLDELCCYIHDSQSDKKSFIKNLKDTYDDFCKNKMPLQEIEQQRQALIDNLKKEVAVLELFHTTHKTTLDNAGISLSLLMHKIIELKKNIPALDAKAMEKVPYYNEWSAAAIPLLQLEKSIEDSGSDQAFSEHPLSNIADQAILSENPISLIDDLISHSKKLLSELNTVIKVNKIDIDFAKEINALQQLVNEAAMLQPLAITENLHLINTSSRQYQIFENDIQEQQAIIKAYQSNQEQNVHWIQKFNPQDIDNAIELSLKSESSFFSFLNGNWRKLKKLLKSNYDFEKHQLKPKYSQVLQQLKDEYNTLIKLQNSKKTFNTKYQTDDIDSLQNSLHAIRNKQQSKELQFLLQHPDSKEIVINLFQSTNILKQVGLQLQQCLVQHESKSIQQLQDELDSIAMNIDTLKDLLPALKAFARLPAALKQAIRSLPLTAVQMEASMAQKTLTDYYQNNKDFAVLDLQAIEIVVNKIEQYYQSLLKLNATLIKARNRDKFLQHLDLTNIATSQLNAEQKIFKKNYNEGRKILENEFGKSMRYKSIRELNTKESQYVLNDLKPVWLMSPLSVSDSIPLSNKNFDVVIFDEASQITLEEGIPSLYRSAQSIIVGDDKQMPPTNFFSANVKDPDDMEQFGEETDDDILSADTDSLLVQGARKLNSTMLSWHYRSRYETLISYSNHAFYEANLLTIPDKAIHHQPKEHIKIGSPEEATQHTDALFDRSISFHHLTNSVYEKRKNIDEANYIAYLIRDLLKNKINESIAIVAFSQEQQSTIEDALSNLAQEDKAFELLLEEAYNRTEEEQFVGLIIKNLENIQGDERDIIIMSVCYGFDSKKKMIMNFGPINKKGGEKRLNVLFSRAKKHMAIISSIQYGDIKNEYNEGANYFRRFLQYAAHVSTGNMHNASAILDGLVVNKSDNNTIKKQPLKIINEIAQQLSAKGYEVQENVGQSNFKCSLAVKSPTDHTIYALGILLDDELHYSNEDVLEQYYQRPAILQAFGWQYINVFAKDWLDNPEKVIENIIKRLYRKPSAIKEVAVADIPFTTNEISNSEAIVENIADKKMQDEEILSSSPSSNDTIMNRYELVSDASNKFWEVGLKENRLIIRFGRIGTNGQTQIKTFDNEDAAKKEMQRLEQEKLTKGYLKLTT